MAKNKPEDALIGHVSGQANKPMSRPAHALPHAAVVSEVGANPRDGLTAAEAQSRMQEYGRNELGEGEGVNMAKILARQVANAMTLVTRTTSHGVQGEEKADPIPSFGIESWIEGGVVAAIIAMNILVGFFQELGAERTMDSLRSLSSPTASAVRDGKNTTVPTAEIVPGDMVEVKTGDTVPADLRLIEAVNFETDEALLTGESLPVRKDAEATFDPDTGPGDRLNIAFSSSTVTKGRAIGCVYATGMFTEIGTIAAALRAKDSKRRPVKRNSNGKARPHRYAQAYALTGFDALGRFLGISVGTPLQVKLSWLAILLLGCAIAWIPSKGTYSVGESNDPYNPTDGMLFFKAKGPRNINLNEDESIEDAASYEKLLHQNQNFMEFLKVSSMANLAHVHESQPSEWKARGDPTEIALQVFASRFHMNRTRFTSGDTPAWKQIAEFPFDSTIKKMSVIFEEYETGKKHVFTKGAVERIIDSCTTIHLDDIEAVPVTSDIKNNIIANMESLASLGLRVLALASRDFTGKVQEGDEARNEIENGLVFRGLVGIYDPPRPESAPSVRQCQDAGITPRMLTGDHPGTASAIATEVGILPSRMEAFSKEVTDAMVMTASQFDKLSDQQIDQLPVLPLVIARCSPSTKVRMIEALHRRGKFAAMTGDGVNDSPSLKRADVGIAMGQAGSDVAKDASDIVLTDDNFASILNAIEEGRRMFDNIQKFILHLLAENVAQATVLLVGLVFKDNSGLSVFPLAPVEIMWVILATSGAPDMGLGFEEAAPDIMARPPQNLKRGVFTFEVLLDIVVYGFWISALCLGAFVLVVYGFGDGNLGQNCNNSYSSSCDTVFRARATTFACLTWFALFLAWEMVDMRRSFFRMQPNSKRYATQWAHDVWRNKFLFWSIMTGFVTVIPTMYIPVINHEVFRHTGISWEWGLVFVATTLFFAGVEAWKWAKRIFFRRMDAKARKTGLPLSQQTTQDCDPEARLFGQYGLELGKAVSGDTALSGEKRLSNAVSTDTEGVKTQ
ncbi:P-type ATPase [Diplodia intermedia]|uniref:P-type Na(+) transporter n=1 Tax=Diplodia intermedia TaxID=856260 RepID=A0ABR3U1S4_9PEZI